VPLDYSATPIQRALIKSRSRRLSAASVAWSIHRRDDPNFLVQKGFKFFTMPWGPWARAGIQNGLSGIKR